MKVRGSYSRDTQDRAYGFWRLITYGGSKEEDNLVNIYGILTVQDWAIYSYIYFLLILTAALWILYCCPHYTDKEAEAQNAW